MRETYIIFLVAFATCLRGGLSSEDTPTPEKRLISTFQIVRFPNDACIGTSSRNGTCYTSAECSDKGGTSSGSCADGFGVCCTFVLTTCGQTTSQNITYWDQTATDPTDGGAVNCDLTVVKMNENICQIRLDFDTFVITGPSTSTIQEHFRTYGQFPQIGTAGNHDANWRSNCLIDRFSVNGLSSSNQPPTICGINTGTHMYVDAHPVSNTLSFRMSSKAGPAPATGAAVLAIDTRGLSTLAKRDWDIKIQQYECGHVNAAPPGCTQYIWGQTSGSFTSYNLAGAEALANQNQRLCVRRERGVCFFCMGGTDANALKVSGCDNTANAYAMTTQACGYGAENKNSVDALAGLGNADEQAGAYDCAIIPGAFLVAIAGSGAVTPADSSAANLRLLTAAAYHVPVAPQISSNGAFGIGGTDANVYANTGSATLHTICTKHVPFMFIFKSDGHEGLGAGGEYSNGAAPKGTNPGINLPWFTHTCT